MNQVLVGTFSLGHQNVDLYALPDDTGGEFYLQPDGVSLPRIKVGINYERWDDVVGVVLHESFEYLLTANNHRYELCGKRTGDSAAFLFSFDHAQFGHLCKMQSYFIADALPKLAEIYNKQQLRMQKRKRK